MGGSGMRTKLVIGILVGASLSGCDVVTAISNGVLSPITPEQSKAQVLTKHDVTVDFAPQNVGTSTRDVELLGECRDVTTNKGDSQTEAITFN